MLRKFAFRASTVLGGFDAVQAGRNGRIEGQDESWMVLKAQRMPRKCRSGTCRARQHHILSPFIGKDITAVTR